MKKKPTLIFDYDGTLHNTIVIYESAFRQCYDWLVKEGYAPVQKISTERISGWLGMNSREMWESFLPELPSEIKDMASDRVGRAMVEEILSHRAVWYPGAGKILDELKEEGYLMVIVSNCKIAYQKANWEEFSLGRWFAEFYNCETFGFAPKTEMIKEVRKKFADPYVVIGDRYSDLECARSCGGRFIGCRYGFGKDGELNGADFLADSVEMLPELIRQAREKNGLTLENRMCYI